MDLDDELKELLKPEEFTQSGKDERVGQTISNIHHDQSMSDIVTLSLSKSFSTLLTILGPLFARGSAELKKRNANE